MRKDLRALPPAPVLPAEEDRFRQVDPKPGFANSYDPSESDDPAVRGAEEATVEFLDFEPVVSGETDSDPFPEIHRDPQPPIHVIANEARFAESAYLPLKTNPKRKLEDPLSQVLSSMQHVDRDQVAFVSVSFRPDHAFRSEAVAWQNSRRYTNAAPPKRNTNWASALWTLLKIAAWPFMVMAWLVFLAVATVLNSPAPRFPFPFKRAETKRTTVPTDQNGNEKLERRTLTPEQLRELDEASTKTDSASFYRTSLRVGVVGEGSLNPQADQAIKDELERDLDSITNQFGKFDGQYQSLKFKKADPDDALLGLMPIYPHKNELVLNHEELTSMAHLPDSLSSVEGVRVEKLLLKPLRPDHPLQEIPDPLNPPPGLIPHGVMNGRTVGTHVSNMDRHSFTVGQTGAGKSVAACWEMFGVAKSGYPLILLDPHGELADDFQRMIISYAPERVKDVVLVDMSDPDYVPALNPLDIRLDENLRGRERSDTYELLVKSSQEAVMSILATQGFSPTEQPRAYTYVRMAVATLCAANLQLPEEQKLSLMHILRFLKDDDFRNSIMPFADNLMAKEVFDPDSGTFAKLSDAQKNEHLGPVSRVLSSLIESPSTSRVFATTHKLDFERLISEKRIIICNMGRFGSDKKIGEMIAAMLVPTILGSMSKWGRRKDKITGEPVGQGVRIFIDEAGAVIHDPEYIMSVLAEARKYDVGLSLITQYPDQFEPALKKAVYANTASKKAFKLGSGTVAGLDVELDGSGEKLGKDDISNIPSYCFYGNLLTNSYGKRIESGVFAAQALAPPELAEPEFLAPKFDAIRDQSRKIVAVSTDLAAARLADGGLYSEPARILREKIRDLSVETKPTDDSPDLQLDLQEGFKPKEEVDFSWE